MEQHPIPQQISSYEFKLVGDMTLKQFLKAATGIILAILINSTSLVALIKWPLMLLVGGGGLLLAFVPFEDRPLEAWFFSFIKSIYSPTVYTYQKKGVRNWLDLDLTKKVNQEDEKVLVIGKVGKTMGMPKIKGSFGDGLKESLKDKFNVIGTKNKTNAKQEVLKTREVVEEKKVDLTEKKTHGAEIENEEKNKQDWRDQKSNLNLKTERLTATGKAIFGKIPMPDIPEIPNIVVGMATNLEGKIVDGVIVEIQDDHGNPSRVLKSNSLGQFKTSTPLANGRYLIIAEKDGYNFDRVNIDLTGEIVQPVKIIANS